MNFCVLRFFPPWNIGVLGPLPPLPSTGTTAAAGGVSHAEAVDAELADLTRVNSHLRGEMVAKSRAWSEEKGALQVGVVYRLQGTSY